MCFKNHSPVFGKHPIIVEIVLVIKLLILPSTYLKPFFLSESLTWSIYFSKVYLVWSNCSKTLKNSCSTFYF